MGGKKFLKKRRNRYDWKIIDDDRMMGGKIAGSLMEKKINKIGIRSKFYLRKSKNRDSSQL